VTLSPRSLVTGPSAVYVSHRLTVSATVTVTVVPAASGGYRPVYRPVTLAVAISFYKLRVASGAKKSVAQDPNGLVRRHWHDALLYRGRRLTRLTVLDLRSLASEATAAIQKG
jgi:hypothetical protein